MLRIVLYPKISALSSHESKTLKNILLKLESMKNLSQEKSYTAAFSYLRQRADRAVIVKDILLYISNIVNIGDEINRTNAFGKYNSLQSSNSEAEDCLVLLEAAGCMVGYSYLLGSIQSHGNFTYD